VGYDLPEDIKINLIVAVDQPVSQAHDLRPGNFWEARAFFFGNPVGRFADNLKQPNQSEIEQTVLIQVSAFSVLNQLDSFPRVVEHVAQGNAGVTA
jgi:hypothetical protein